MVSPNRFAASIRASTGLQDGSANKESEAEEKVVDAAAPAIASFTRTRMVDCGADIGRTAQLPASHVKDLKSATPGCARRRTTRHRTRVSSCRTTAARFCIVLETNRRQVDRVIGHQCSCKAILQEHWSPIAWTIIIRHPDGFFSREH